MKDQKRTGVIISYVNLAISMLVNIFITPMLIATLSDDYYSIYKVMQSFAGPLAMFNLGISTIVTRAIVQYNVSIEKNKSEKQNKIAMAMLVSLLMAGVIIVAAVVMRQLIPTIYGDNYTDKQIVVAQKIFIFFAMSTVFHILSDVFSGCVLGNEKYIFSSCSVLLKSILKIFFVLLFISFGVSVVVISAIDFIIAVIIFIILAFYSFVNLKEIPKLTHLDKHELFTMFTFSAAILLQAIVNQVNNNVDSMILGVLESRKEMITMYSSALVIYSIYNSLVSVIAHFYLPKATELITNKASGEELTNFMITPGRFQAIIAVGVVTGFAVFGKEFITIWIGEQYINAYYIALILIIPMTIPLVENTANTILNAALKRLYQSVILFIMAVINVFVSILLIKVIGYWGAALGTALSVIVGQIILMNIYYHKEFGICIGKLFFSIFKGILPSGIITGILCIPLALLLKNSIGYFVLEIALFLIVYGITLWLFGLNSFEKKYIDSFTGNLREKIFRRNKK